MLFWLIPTSTIFSFHRNQEATIIRISPLLVSLSVHSCLFFYFLVPLLDFIFYIGTRKGQLVPVSLYIHASFFIFFYTVFDISNNFQIQETPD